MAISADGKSWFLLNASPDLRAQIEATPALYPNDGTRSSPISGVVLTGADLDQIAGLLSLRELQPFRIYCTPALRSILREGNLAFGMLNRISNQVLWSDIIPGEDFSLASVTGEDCGLRCESFSIGTRYPVYVGERSGQLAPGEASLGLLITSIAGRKLAFLPAIPKIDEQLMKRMETADVLLFDGTFWSDDELIRVQGSGATAAEMGHITVSSASGSLKNLASLQKPRKIFIHVNNTNPMLNECSAEYREVRAAGWEVAEDGWRIDL